MIVQCAGCKTRFRLADEKVRPTGTKVRCSRCGSTFLVTPPAPALPVQDEPSFNDMQTLVAPVPRELLAHDEPSYNDVETRVAPVPRELLADLRRGDDRTAPQPPPQPAGDLAGWDLEEAPQTFGDTFTDVTFGPGAQVQQHVRIPDAPPVDDDPLAILGPAPELPPLGTGGRPPPPPAQHDPFCAMPPPPPPPQGQAPFFAAAAPPGAGADDDLFGELLPPPRPPVRADRDALFGELPAPPRPAAPADRDTFFAPGASIERERRELFGEAPPRPAPAPVASDAFVADPARLAEHRASLETEQPSTGERRLATAAPEKLAPTQQPRVQELSPARRLLRLASGAAVLATALACFVVARNGGSLQVDAPAVLAAFGLGEPPAGATGLVADRIRTGRYDTAAGELLFVRGTIVNQAEEPLGPAVRVVAELRDGERVVARGVGWAGGEPTPEQVHELRDAEQWGVVADRLGAGWSKPLAAGESAPFFVVLGGSTEDAAALRLRIAAAPADAPTAPADARTVAADEG